MQRPEVRVEHVPLRTLAAVRTPLARDTLARDMIACLDRVWAFLRAHPEIRRDHNVVIYGPDGTMTAGVEVFDDFEPAEGIERHATPAGRVVTAAHIGPYREMSRTYAAIEAWLGDTNTPTTGVSWEVYGDHTDDESRLRTDIFFQVS